MESAYRNKVLLVVAGLITLFFAWRISRPINIFVVSDEFALPMKVIVPAGLETLHASECGECHAAIYKEWSESMHANAWRDPYYQVDFVFDGSQQVCLNCHIPLQDQQENLVLGFEDKARFKPILAPNPNFNLELQQEGVTCAVCHIRDGVIVGPYADTDAPHPTRQDKTLAEGIGVCRKCHVVSGDLWDTFFRIPPCGTVAEIRENEQPDLNCVGCHMPATERPLATGFAPRRGRMHLWRGGHDQEMVRRALKVDLDIDQESEDGGKATLTLTNTGAAHYLPSGTPDRHLTVEFVIRAGNGAILQAKTHKLKRTIIWRPFIVDLWDTRLPKNKPRIYNFNWARTHSEREATLEITVRYHLLDEARKKRIGYQNSEPIAYQLFQEKYNLGQ
jgi:hypothetical protein